MAKNPIEIGPTGRAVAMSLRRLRSDRGLSLRELSARTTAAGRTIEANALNKSEHGKRRLDVDDLMVLAAALDVTPTALMLPVMIDREQPVKITGVKGPVSAQRAWRWMVGEQPLPGQMGECVGDTTEAFRGAARPWWMRQDA